LERHNAVLRRELKGVRGPGDGPAWDGFFVNRAGSPRQVEQFADPSDIPAECRPNAEHPLVGMQIRVSGRVILGERTRPIVGTADEHSRHYRSPISHTQRVDRAVMSMRARCRTGERSSARLRI
jgi:hypothetical protein